MNLAHAMVTGPSEIASHTQMDSHPDTIRNIAMCILQTVEVNSIEITISIRLVGTVLLRLGYMTSVEGAACGLMKFLTRCRRQLI